MRNILLLLIFILIELQAQIIDAIAIDVNGEPITILEIEAVQSKLNMSKKAAIEALIKDRLEKSAVEEADITVSAEDINAKIEQIASARRINREDMKKALTKRGLTWEGYKKQLEIEIKKEKFFAKTIASTISRPTEEELKLYYQTHKDKFSSDTPTTQVSLIAYASNSSMKLQEVIANPMKIVDGVQQQSMLVSSRDITPKLFNIINQTPEGSFTRPINTGRGFITYFIKSKSTQGDMSFEMVKNRVAMEWLQEERIKASKNFLNKLKNRANIRVIRL